MGSAALLLALVSCCSASPFRRYLAAKRAFEAALTEEKGSSVTLRSVYEIGREDKNGWPIFSAGKLRIYLHSKGIHFDSREGFPNSTKRITDVIRAAKKLCIRYSSYRQSLL